MQEEETRITTIIGTSDCRAFCSGFRFDLKNHFRSDLKDKSLVLTQVVHSASQEGSYLTGGGESDFAYQNHFTCIPFEIPYRPLRVTPKPVVQGSQTAIVTGPSGEEIHTDEHGRVKVQFHWDREGKKDDKTSCWIRVSQAWAGAGWGAVYIPRIGQEVVVDFLEGDPDRPIIIGRVYHGTNKPPYDLPAEKTKSTIKSDSSKGGGGSNELRFEDKKGSEEIYLHGQKDWTIGIENDKNQTVGNNETLSVGTNRDKTVGSDQSENIGANKTIQVGSNHDETIGANKTMNVGANHTESIGANMSQNVGSAKTETISMAKALTIGAAYQVTVGGAMNETVGAVKAEEIGGAKIVAVGAHSSENVLASKSVNAGRDISQSAGKNVSWDSGQKMSLHSGDDFSVKGDKKGVIEIKDQLTIKVGKASITLKKNGDIIIDGKNINTKGSGNIVMKAKKIMEN
jgi:type VI secretion system secreted protein VgrG